MNSLATDSEAPIPSKVVASITSNLSRIKKYSLNAGSNGLRRVSDTSLTWRKLLNVRGKFRCQGGCWTRPKNCFQAESGLVSKQNRSKLALFELVEGCNNPEWRHPIARPNCVRQFRGGTPRPLRTMDGRTRSVHGSGPGLIIWSGRRRPPPVAYESDKCLRVSREAAYSWTSIEPRG